MQAFADRADALMASKDVHAVAIAIARRGSVIGDIVRGSTPSGAALTTDSRFRIASISKVPLAIVVIGTILLHLPVGAAGGLLAAVDPSAVDGLVRAGFTVVGGFTAGTAGVTLA